MLRVLTYHRIADPGTAPDLDPGLVSATVDAFRKQMRHLRRWDQPVSLEQILDGFAFQGALPRRAVHVTVDDAYRDFAEVAWPILRSLEIPATVFVPTAYPGHPERTFWWDRLHRAMHRGTSERWRARVLEAVLAHNVTLPGPRDRRAASLSPRALLPALPHTEAERLVEEAYGREQPPQPNEPAVLSWDEIRELASEGVTFGAHTRSHATLAHLSPDEVRAEIRGSLRDLDRELGPRRWALAYPYGAYNGTAARIAREVGCSLAFTCENGLSAPGRTDPMRLRRTNVTPRTTPGVFALRMLPWFAPVDRMRHRLSRRPGDASCALCT